jgi:hypothetical protein
VTDADGGQAARNPPRPLVYLTPGMPDGSVWLTGHHAVYTGLGGAIHLFGESAHDRSFGTGVAHCSKPWIG